MGFLHKLWDETLAGPTPDTGLGKLRKYNSFSAARSSAPPDLPMDDQVPISRSITILRSNSTSLRNVNVSADSGSAPSSPAASSTPTSPFSPTTPGENVKKLTRRRSMTTETKSPKGYDWIVLSALDR